ncbi:gag-pol polyprotein, partial [Trifolium medium]|nr:gag-pol polyprotein [Trifolium medium]
IAKNERAKLLVLQSLPDSYDQLIINITNNNIAVTLHFDDIVGAILEEESRLKNKEVFKASRGFDDDERCDDRNYNYID